VTANTAQTEIHSLLLISIVLFAYDTNRLMAITLAGCVHVTAYSKLYFLPVKSSTQLQNKQISYS